MRAALRLGLVAACLAAAACSRAPAPGAKAEALQAAAPAPAGHQMRGTAPHASAGVTVVTLTPVTPKTFPPPADEAQLDQVNETFVPALLFVRTGQPVLFLNNDDTLHNVRVREAATGDGTFNVAIPTGGRYTFTFPRDGFYIVGCDIHPAMAAAIFAASTPYVTVAEDSGDFSFEDVEPGSYTVTAYLDGRTVTRRIDVRGLVTAIDFDTPS
jgi:plastocyanin